jgi:hypothetical protein
MRAFVRLCMTRIEKRMFLEVFFDKLIIDDGHDKQQQQQQKHTHDNSALE